MGTKINEYGDVLNVSDVKDILDIGYNKTYELLKTGAIHSFKIGRERKIPKQSLIEYIEKQLSSS